jgi:hypothetical protein
MMLDARTQMIAKGKSGEKVILICRLSSESICVEFIDKSYECDRARHAPLRVDLLPHGNWREFKRHDAMVLALPMFDQIEIAADALQKKKAARDLSLATL